MRYIGLAIAAAWAQTTLYFQNFNGSSTNSPPPGWQLNTTDMGGATPPSSYNEWRIGAHYTGHPQNVCVPAFNACFNNAANPPDIPNQPASIAGGPNSEFIHISFSGYQCCPTPPPPSACFVAVNTNLGFPPQTYFAKYTTGVSIPAGATNVRLTLFWICYGNANAYGEVLYSTAGPNGPWTALTSSVTNSTKFYTASGSWQQWRADTIPLPVTPPTTVYIALRFVNQTGGNNDPPFIVDDIGVIADLSSNNPTISLTSATPNPVCAGNQLSVAFTHSGFSGSPSFQAQLLDASNNVVVSSATSTSSPITFTIPSTLASGNYSVRVVSGAVQSNTQSLQVINLSSFSCSASATTVQAGNPVTFTLNGGPGFPSSGTLNVTFDPGNGSGTTNLTYTLPGQLPATYSYTYPSAGVYVATFTANLGGCSQTCSQTITVTSAPVLTLTSVSHNQVCAGGSIQVSYTASGFPPGTQYTAQLLSGSTVVASASGASPITLTIPASTPSGTYTVRVQANTTPVTNSNTLSIQVLNLSSFTVTCSASPSSANAGTAVSLSVNITPTPPLPVNVTMDPGDGGSSQTVSNTTTFPQNFSHTYTQAGSYTVTFTISYPAPGCTLTCTQSVNISPVITLGSVANSVCAGSSLSVPFTATGFPAGTTFTAEVRDVNNALVASGNGTSSPITVSIPATLPSGAYTVRVVSGSHQSGTANVEVINLSGFTCTASATSIQAGQSVTFTLSGSNLPSSGTLSVSFTPGDGSPAQNLTYNLPGDLPATITYTYASAGSFTASFSVSYGGCTHTCTQNISVTGSSGPSLVIGAVASPLCAGGGVTVPFQANGFPSGTTFTVEIAPANSSSWTALCSGTSSPISCTLDGQMAGGSYVVRVRGGTPPVYSQERPIEVVQMQGLTCTISPSPAYVNEPISVSIGGAGLPSGPFSIAFSPGGSLPTQNQNTNSLPTTFTYTYTSTGAYSVQITVTHTTSGCMGRCNIPLSVQSRPAGNPSSLVAISPDGQNILVKEGTHVELFDALGRTIYVGPSSEPIPIMRNMLYILRVWSGNNLEVFRFYAP